MSIENSDQMDGVSSGHAPNRPPRVPRTNLRRQHTGALMNQPHTVGGQFQGAHTTMPSHRMPVQRQLQRGQMFRQFMNRSGGKVYDPNRNPDIHQHVMSHPGNGPSIHTRGPVGPRPIGRPIIPPIVGRGGVGGHSLPPGQIMPGGGPIIGHQVPNMGAHALMQAILGDIGNGLTQQQFNNMSGGHTPGHENGDFAALMQQFGLNTPQGQPNLMQQIAGLMQPNAPVPGQPNLPTMFGAQNNGVHHLLRQILGLGKSPFQNGGRPVMQPIASPIVSPTVGNGPVAY